MIRFLKLCFRTCAYVCIAMLSTVALATCFILLGENGTAADTPPDCLLVFGSAVYGWNTPGPAMLRRVSTAARIYDEDGSSVKKLIFTGGRTNETDQSEAQVMAQYAKRQGIPASAITLEERATSTWENIEYSTPLIEGCEQVLALSDGYHLARIRLTARLQGWGRLPTVPSDESPTLPQHARSVVRELAAIGYYVFAAQDLGSTDR